MPKRIKIIGPPGTGKTETLLTLLKKEFEKGCTPSQCAYVSFTKKGAYEGVQRVSSHCNIPPKELKYFRTLHSLCFRHLRVSKFSMIRKSDYIKIGNAVNLNFSSKEEEDGITTEGDLYLHAYYMMRNNPKEYASLVSDLSAKRFTAFVATFEEYKQRYGKLDYTDLLLRMKNEGSPLPVDVAFIDEAQDLTTLQWELVDKLFKNAEVVYAAGDDDQAIYKWAGADLKRFQSFGDETLILKQSYRIPQKIHMYATSLISCVTNRIPKTFAPKNEHGELGVVLDWKQLPSIIKGPTLILGRTAEVLKPARQVLKENGINHTYKGEPTVDPKILRAIYWFRTWQKGLDINAEHMLSLYEEYFTSLNRESPWHAVMRDKGRARYYKALMDNNTDFEKSPLVDVSTIHGSKGAECDHVILALEYGAKVQDTIHKSPEDEFRVLYVGATRAKQKLTLKLRETEYGYPETLGVGNANFVRWFGSVHGNSPETGY